MKDYPVMFDEIEPEDVKMGLCENCYLCATLSGLAERDMNDDIDENEKTDDITLEDATDLSKNVFNIFLTRNINAAGCYALKLCIDGETREVVVDDYLPMRKNEATGEWDFAFCRSKDINEIWSCLVEKALAKLCGCYEQTEHLLVSDTFYALAGGPTTTYNISEFQLDIRRGKKLEEERFDKFYQLINEASKKEWVVTGTTPKLPEEIKKKAKGGHLDNLRLTTINNLGIKYNHCYTLLETRKIVIRKTVKAVNINDYTDIIALYRNPAGKEGRLQNWSGDWGPDCDLWSKETKKQLGDETKLMTEQTFWMSLEDMFKQFETFTINQCMDDWGRRTVAADIINKKMLSNTFFKIPSMFFGTPWGVQQIKFRQYAQFIVLSLWQQNFMYIEEEWK
jgi:hypothetical protein